MTEKQISILKKIRNFEEGKVVPRPKRPGTAAEGSGFCTSMLSAVSPEMLLLMIRKCGEESKLSLECSSWQL